MKHLKEEDGSITIFVIGILALMMVLFVFVMNLSSVLAVKDQANTTSQQASLAATSVLYEEVQNLIGDYEEDTFEGKVNSFFEEFDEKVEERKDDLRRNGSYSEWTNHELRLEAIDQVLEEELDKPASRAKLREYFDDEMDEIIRKMRQKAKASISANGGSLEEAEMKIDNNRIYVRASNEFQSTGFKRVLADLKENIFRSSAGPKINFLSDIWGSRDKTLGL
ncbi:Tad domain-containing protein [Pontibacillus salipaludis]|uniref:Tad domain-containing protein n=1 Tax=Pontibacillus salipaludis TaxID=1697394 RepID=UPI0031EBB6CF